MQIILRNKNSEYIKTISLKDLNPLDKDFLKLISIKEPLEAHIFAINETISSHELAKFKINIKKLNVNSINIYSNKRETIIAGNYLRVNSSLLNEKILKKMFLNLSKKQEDTLHKGTVERISSNGDLFIVGDVNPGAIVSARESVYIWGKLLGIAFAGESGNQEASIVSIYLKPLQLRICGVVAIGPKEKPKNYYPEKAILKNKSIIIEPYLLRAFN